MKSCILVVDGAVSLGLPDLLDQWETDRKAEGWKVLNRVVSPPTLEGLISILSVSRADHTFLVGDSIPFKIVMDEPEGHFVHECEADYYIVSSWLGKIGRLYFKEQTLSGKASIDLYKAYFIRRHNWNNTCKNLGLKNSYIDYLSGTPDLASIEYWIQYSRDHTPKALYEERHGGGGIGPDIPNQDWNYQALGTNSRLIVNMFSGGTLSPDPGLLVIGGSSRWRQYDPKVGILTGFGSMQSIVRGPNSWLMSTLTGSTTIAVLYNWGGTLQIWRLFEGLTVGEIGRSGQNTTLSNVYGDPTVELSNDVLTAAQILASGSSSVTQDQFNALAARVTALESGKIITSNPPSPITVNSARYEQVADPTKYVDMTQRVQDLYNSGKDFYVYHDTLPHLPDPFVGIPKQLTVNWTRNGVTTSHTFAQRDQILL